EALAPFFKSVPAELKARPQWVVWRYEWKADKSKWDKPPRGARTGHYIDVTNPENWVAFDEAVTAYKDGGWDGIGYAFDENDPYCGIDLDHCVVNGELSETASDWVWRFQTYAEISPSGTGIKLICKAKALHNGKNPAAGAEIYDRTRYFTITGH